MWNEHDHVLTCIVYSVINLLPNRYNAPKEYITTWADHITRHQVEKSLPFYAMAAIQYRDLPLIPQSMDESNYPGWNVEHDNYMSFQKHQDMMFSPQESIYLADYCDNGMVMDRFLHDQYSFPQGLLHAKFPFRHSLTQHFEPQWASADYYRNASPDPSSGNSSNATQSELRSPQAYSAVPYGSPMEVFPQSAQAYTATEHFADDGYMSQTPLHGGCNLRELEYEHPEPEPVAEDNVDVEIKAEASSVIDPVVIKQVEESSDGPADYTDSGIGTSVRDAESVQPIGFDDDPSSDSDYNPTSRSGKRRRSSASNSSSTKASKRRGSTRKDSAACSPRSNVKASRRPRKTSNAGRTVSDLSDDRRHFPCPLATYGCTSTFSSKNEWKRHVSTQHIKIGFWRCDLCPPTVDANDDQTFYYNDFNRKDLFTQHLRRMHATSNRETQSRNQKACVITDENLAEHQNRCLQSLRKPPQQSTCLFCDKKFVGPNSWEERMEHVGKHLEKDRKIFAGMFNCKTWHQDQNLENYLVEEGLIVKEANTWKIGNGKPKRHNGEHSDDEEE